MCSRARASPVRHRMDADAGCMMHPGQNERRSSNSWGRKVSPWFVYTHAQMIVAAQRPLGKGRGIRIPSLGLACSSRLAVDGWLKAEAPIPLPGFWPAKWTLQARGVFFNYWMPSVIVKNITGCQRLWVVCSVGLCIHRVAVSGFRYLFLFDARSSLGDQISHRVQCLQSIWYNCCLIYEKTEE